MYCKFVCQYSFSYDVLVNWPKITNSNNTENSKESESE